MIFVLVITLWSLAGLTMANLRAASGLDVQMLNAISAAALILLALFLAVTALLKVRGERKAALAAEAA